jgi:hypothetical protein
MGWIAKYGDLANLKQVLMSSKNEADQFAEQRKKVWVAT